MDRHRSRTRRNTARGVASSDRPSYQRASQMNLPVASAHGTTAAVSGSGNRSWSPYPTSSLYRVPPTTSERVSSTLAPPYMFSPRSAYPWACWMGTIFDREVPCISGSSNRTRLIPCRPQSSRISPISAIVYLLDDHAHGGVPILPWERPGSERAALPNNEHGGPESVGGQEDVLQLGVVLEPVVAELAAHTGLLEAAERRGHPDRGVRVDRDRSGLDGP